MASKGSKAPPSFAAVAAGAKPAGDPQEVVEQTLAEADKLAKTTGRAGDDFPTAAEVAQAEPEHPGAPAPAPPLDQPPPAEFKDAAPAPGERAELAESLREGPPEPAPAAAPAPANGGASGAVPSDKPRVEEGEDKGDLAGTGITTKPISGDSIKERLPGRAGEKLAGAAEAAKDQLAGVAGAAKDQLAGAAAAAKDQLAGAAGAVQNAAGAGADKAQDATGGVGEVVQQVQHVAGEVVHTAGGMMGGVANATVAGAAATVGTIGHAAGAAVDALKRTVGLGGNGQEPREGTTSEE